MTSDLHSSHVRELRTSAVRSRHAQNDSRLGKSDAKLGPLWAPSCHGNRSEVLLAEGSGALVLFTAG